MWLSAHFPFPGPVSRKVPVPSLVLSVPLSLHASEGRAVAQLQVTSLSCPRALGLVPFSLKPLLRRASAYEALEKYPLAYVDYKTALQVDDRVTSALDGVNR